MKMKERMKRFFTMNLHHADGFTLVELIVVIAILAILAGVALPVYNGYIQKAKRASDEVLLGAVNEAFAVACAANDTDVFDVVAAEVNWKDGCVIGINKVGNLTGNAVAPYDEAFKLFFQGNETTKFQVIEALVFDANMHVFVDLMGSGMVTINYKGSNIVLSGAALKALKASSFLNGTELKSTQDLLNKVAMVTDIAKGMADGKLAAVFRDPQFHAVAMAALGATSEKEYKDLQEQMVKDIMEEQGIDATAAQAQLEANAAVLYASKYAAGYTREDITKLFTEVDKSVVRKNLLNEDGSAGTAEGMAQATLIYGMYVAYANSTGNPDYIANSNDPSYVLQQFNDDEDFKDWVLNEEQGQNDMQAYLSTLGMINDAAASSPEAVKDLMIYGFNNADLAAALKEQLGK